MLYATIILFAVAAVIGITLAVSILNKKETNKTAVFAHGGIAAVGLVLLIIYAIQNPNNAPMTALVIFIVAALGGFYLFYNDMNKKPGPSGVVIIHALAAVTAFVMLLMFVFI